MRKPHVRVLFIEEPTRRKNLVLKLQEMKEFHKPISNTPNQKIQSMQTNPQNLGFINLFLSYKKIHSHLINNPLLKAQQNDRNITQNGEEMLILTHRTEPR